MSKIKSNATQQYADNVLLEIELALIRKQTEPEGTMAIFPVFVGTNPTVYLSKRGAQRIFFIQVETLMVRIKSCILTAQFRMLTRSLMSPTRGDLLYQGPFLYFPPFISLMPQYYPLI
jgi:hypothetical protein